MINQDVDPDLEDFARLVNRLQETPTLLASIVNEFHVLSEPPASAGESDLRVGRPNCPPANAGSSDIFRWRDSDGEFSALEHVCHLRDIEVEGYAFRINRILADANPLLADIDGGLLAVERNYNEQDPVLALQAFFLGRTKNVEKLSGVDTQAPGRKGILEGVGELTLKRLVEMMQEHDESHLDELRLLRQRLQRRLTSGNERKLGSGQPRI
jgi:hypothetical protein